MKILIAVAVLTVLALIGSRRVPGSAPDAPAVQMLFTGSEFIVIGLLLGSDFVNLIDEHTLVELRPFVYVALGWLALLFGLQLDRRTVRRLPSGFVAIAAFVAVATAVVVAPVGWLLLRQFTAAPTVTVALATATLAASAACSGQAAIALADRGSGPAHRNAMSLLRFVSSLDPAVGVTVFGIALAALAAHPIGPAAWPWTLQWAGVSVALGVLTAWVFVSLTLTRTSQAELVLYLLGVIAVSSGVALGFDLSVLFISFVTGVVIANLAHVRSIRGRVMDLMVRGERFLYLLLLVVAGASWHLPTAGVLAAAAVYAGARLVAKVTGTYLTTGALTRRHPVPNLVGLGLVSQGGMGLAILVEYRLAVEEPLAAVVVGVAVTAVLVNELAAPWLVRSATRGRGGGRP
jgi:hypothetical protein